MLERCLLCRPLGQAEASIHSSTHSVSAFWSLLTPHLGLLCFLSYLEPCSHFSDIIEHPCVNSECVNLCCTNRADTPTPSVVPAVNPSRPLSTTVGGCFRTPHSSEPSNDVLGLPPKKPDSCFPTSCTCYYNCFLILKFEFENMYLFLLVRRQVMWTKFAAKWGHVSHL